MPMNLSDLRSDIETSLQKTLQNIVPNMEKSPLVATFHQEMGAAHNHPIQAGGKRMRPILLLLCAASMGGEAALHNAFPAAMAVELVHTYSLVHDDLPCMDDDDLRRGQPTTHKIYGDAKALLVGDGLLTQAFSELARMPAPNSHLIPALVEALSLGAGAQGMVWGQWLDISMMAQAQSHVTWEDVVTIHRYKTGALLGACFEMGLLCGLNQHNPPQLSALREQMRTAGIQLGLSFQIWDDVLDVTQSQETLGKTPQKDVVQQKATAVSLLGLEGAKQAAHEASQKTVALLQSCLQAGPTQASISPFQELLFAYMDGLTRRTF